MTTENKVTPASIDARIKAANFIQVKDTTLTICVIEMINGFMVTGESACVDPAIFDAETGREMAYDNAYEKLWALEGYLLKEKMRTETKIGVPA